MKTASRSPSRRWMYISKTAIEPKRQKKKYCVFVKRSIFLHKSRTFFRIFFKKRLTKQNICAIICSSTKNEQIFSSRRYCYEYIQYDSRPKSPSPPSPHACRTFRPCSKTGHGACINKIQTGICCGRRYYRLLGNV